MLLRLHQFELRRSRLPDRIGLVQVDRPPVQGVEYLEELHSQIAAVDLPIAVELEEGFGGGLPHLGMLTVGCGDLFELHDLVEHRVRVPAGDGFRCLDARLPTSRAARRLRWC